MDSSFPRRAPVWHFFVIRPVKRGLVLPGAVAVEQFPSLCFGSRGVVEIESQWTARKREQLWVVPQVIGSQNPRPVSAQNAETRTGQPRVRFIRKGWASPQP